PRAFRRCKAHPPSRGVRRFLDELAAENADPGAGSNLGLPAASGGDARAQPVEERAGDVPSGAGGPEPSADSPSLSRAAMECNHFPAPALLQGFASIGESVAVEAKEELFRIVVAMRGPHGPKLKDIPG